MPRGIYKRTKEQNKKNSESTKKRYARGERFGFQKGNPSGCNKGKKFSLQWRENLSKSHKGYIMPEKQKKKIKEAHLKSGLKPPIMKGEKNPNWKGGITSLKNLIRHSFKYRQWVSDIFTGQDFICQECGERGGKLHAHHIKEFPKILEENNIKTLEEALNCEELWNLNNGRTLCKKCHKLTDNYLKR